MCEKVYKKLIIDRSSNLTSSISPSLLTDPSLRHIYYSFYTSIDNTADLSVRLKVKLLEGKRQPKALGIIYNITMCSLFNKEIDIKSDRSK